MASSKVRTCDAGDAAVGQELSPQPVGSEVSMGQVQQSSTKRYLLSFQRNQKFELTIEGKIVEVFGPGEAKEVDAWVVNHRDFEAYRGLFAVQEVV